MMSTVQRRFAPMVIGIDWNPDRHQIGISDRHRWNTHEANIVAVRFESLDKGVGSFTDVHVYMPEIQPTIIGYVTIPVEYEQLVRLERPIILSGCFPPGSPEFRGQVFCCIVGVVARRR